MQCHVYLGVRIGRKCNSQQVAASNLYSKANLMIGQNSDLSKLLQFRQSMGIRSYGCVFALENMLEVSPKLRAAHRYITWVAHRRW